MIVLFSPRAEAEYAEAYLWYELKLTGLGEKFDSEVRRTIELLAHSPELFPLKRKNYREAPLNRFPFVVIYRIDKSRNIILLQSFFHYSRNPGKKPK